MIAVDIIFVYKKQQIPLKLLSMSGEQFYSTLVDTLQIGDVLHTAKNGNHYVFSGWYKGNIQFSGTPTNSIPRYVLVAVWDAMNQNIRISAGWLRENELERFTPRIALIKSIISKYEHADTIDARAVNCLE